MNNKTKPSRALPAIVIGGLLAGACDIIFAFLFYGNRTPSVSPMRVLQSVASGVFGANAFTGGAKMAAAGFIFHFLIATIFAAIFYLASRQLTFLIATIASAVVFGIIYGAMVYGAMNYIVLPLSNIPFKPNHSLAVVMPGLLIHMFGIGLSIALVTRWFSK